MQTTSENIVFLFIAAMAGAGLLAVSIILLQIRSRNRLLVQQRKLQEAQLEHQKDLLHAVIRMQEEERTRIGRDLHDEVGSALSSLRLMIERFTEKTPGQDAFLGFRTQSKQIIDRVIADTRNISHNLSPIASGQYAFADALEDLCDQVNHSGKMPVMLNFDAGDAETRLQHHEALALYRVLSELINNSVKHAGGTGIWIDFTTANGCLQIAYKDDGKGMATVNHRKSGMGMGNMESRLGMIGARYEITTAPGKGFQMLIQLPKSE